MKSRRFISVVLVALGILMGLGTAWMAVHGLHAPARILKTPDGAQARVEEMMSSICTGDFEGAAACIYGTPDLGAVPENADPAVSLLWDAYRSSFSGVSLSELRATDSGISVDVSVTCLDLSAVLAGLEDDIRAFVEGQNAARREDEAPYNVKRDLWQDLTEKILPDVLENREHSVTVTIDLIYDRGWWWVLPTDTLTDLLSGSFGQ